MRKGVVDSVPSDEKGNDVGNGKGKGKAKQKEKGGY